MYDKENIFAKIIRGEIPSSKIYEDEYIIAIKDINPVAPIHILVITKGEYKDFRDFSQRAKAEEIVHYFTKIAEIAKDQGAKEYRVVSNNGSTSGQTVFHFHTHIISGTNFSRLI
ncbi:MAG: HIT domain-containing protein [Rickettsiaceae bacterium]